MIKDNIYLRWKGEESGPFTAQEVRSKIAHREISLLHHVRVDQEIFKLHDWLKLEEQKTAMTDSKTSNPPIPSDFNPLIAKVSSQPLPPSNPPLRQRSPLTSLAGVILAVFIVITLVRNSGPRELVSNPQTIAALNHCAEVWKMVETSSPDISAALQALGNIDPNHVSPAVIRYAADFNQCLTDLQAVDQEYKKGLAAISSSAQNDAMTGGAILGFVTVALGNGSFEDSLRRSILSGLAAKEWADDNAKAKVAELEARLEPIVRKVYTDMQKLKTTHQSLAAQIAQNK